MRFEKSSKEGFFCGKTMMIFHDSKVRPKKRKVRAMGEEKAMRLL